MSLTGSLMTYDNNNDLMNTSTEKMVSNNKKSTIVNQGLGQKQPLVAVSTQTGAGSQSSRKKKSGCCGKVHLNSLWSLWYGLLAVVGQSYILMQSVKGFLGYSTLDWTGDPPTETWWCLFLLGAAALLLPPFLGAAAFRTGNLPNDGFKLGAALTTCSHGPPSSLPGAGRTKNTGVLRSLWQHGGPTAPFLHLVTAFCLLLPRLLMEAKLIEAGFLPQDTIWRTDLDFAIANRDRLVVLSYMSTSNNISTLPTPLPVMTSSPSPSPLTSIIMPSSTTTSTTTPQPITTLLPAITTILEESTLPKASTKVNPPTQSQPKRSQIRNKGSKSTSTTTSAPTSSTTMRPLEKKEEIKNFRNITNPQPRTLPFSMEKTLRDLLGSEPWDPKDPQSGWGASVSLEFLNYAIALLVYAVRYPAVFWSTNKCFGLIFSFQLLVNGLQSLLAFAGMSVLYKVQVVGVDKALPLLRHRSGINLFGGESPFLLNPHVTLALFVLSGVLILSSSLVLYLYGYGRFNAFLNTEREKRVIMVKECRASNGWGYFTHCAALCVLLAIAVCCAPLLHDYTVVYRGSLDASVLVCVVSTILHLFLWVLVWLFLTVKQKWVFKLRVTIGKAAVRSARSIKLVTDVDLIGSFRDDDLTSQPLLVVGNGRTYTVSDNSPKKAIMTVIQKAALDKKSKATGSEDDSEEQIYWLRPKTVTLNPSDSTDKLAWFNKKLTSNNGGTGKAGQKVTFNDVPCTSNTRNKERGASLRIGEADDGDYATLRELPVGLGALGDPGDDTSEEGKLLACVRDDSVTYACTNRDLVPPCDYEDPSPLLTPEALPDPPTEQNSQTSPVTTSSAVTVHTNDCQSSSATPRCLRRADSGVPGEEPHRSGSGSSGSSPPDPPGSSTSESSSGVHSSASLPNQRPRANSLDDFVLDHQPKDETRLKSFSLQRGALPPSFKHDSAQSVYGFSGIHFTTIVHPVNGNVSENGIPSTIIENAEENTVIIRRKSMQPKVKAVNTPPVINEEPFGRSTNMKMTTFTNSKESLRNTVASSATLPHYPTQPVDLITPHCSTMPLALEARGVMLPPSMASGSSCQSFSRPHCTLPTHQGGLRLVGAVQAIRRSPAQPRAGSMHHSFPVHLIQPQNYGMHNHSLHETERDSANFSMASSGDSDNNMYLNANRA